MFSNSLEVLNDECRHLKNAKLNEAGLHPALSPIVKRQKNVL
ncbi:hypothetical protein AXX16_2082 [Serratia rubidaea]|nr:hypothetical protein AXX16_2082 [Serratia rubidaea]